MTSHHRRKSSGGGHDGLAESVGPLETGRIARRKSTRRPADGWPVYRFFLLANGGEMQWVDRETNIARIDGQRYPLADNLLEVVFGR